MINKARIDGNNNIVIQDAQRSTITINATDIEALKQLDQEQLTAVQHLLNDNSDVMFERIKSFLKSFVPDKSFPKNLTAYTRIVREDIVGREDELKEVRRRLLEDKKLSLINGMGGIGKTTLAAVYVNTYASNYDHIAWLTIESTLEDAIIASRDLRTNLKLEDIPSKELLNICMNKLRNMHSIQPGLLVLDNATEELAKLYDHLPNAPHWHVLVTSRERIEPFSLMELGFLTEAEAILLFQKYNDSFSEEEARSFVQEVEYHTLTIEILAKSAKKNRWDAETVKRAISIDARAGVATSHSGHEKIDRIKSYLIQIFQVSKLDEQEEYVLKQFTALPNQWISYGLLITLLQVNQLDWKDDFSGSLETLYEKGYILKDEEKDSYKMHPVLVEVLSSQLRVTIDDLSLLIGSLNGLLSIDQAKDNPAEKVSFIPFGEAIIRRFPNNTPAMMALKVNLALVYKISGKYEQAKILFTEVLAAVSNNYNSVHSARARALSDLGLVYRDLGEYKSARDLLEEALNIDLNNENEKAIAETQSNLGLVYKDLKQYDKARDLMEQALRLTKNNFEITHSAVARVQSNLGLIYKDMKEYEQARELLEQALESDTSNFEEGHPIIALRRSNLALVYHYLKEYEKAKDLYQKALNSNIKSYGDMHPNTALFLFNLGAAYRDLGELEKTKDLWKRSYHIYLNTLGAKHPKTLNVKSSLKEIEGE